MREKKPLLGWNDRFLPVGRNVTCMGHLRLVKPVTFVLGISFTLLELKRLAQCIGRELSGQEEGAPRGKSLRSGSRYPRSFHTLPLAIHNHISDLDYVFL